MNELDVIRHHIQQAHVSTGRDPLAQSAQDELRRACEDLDNRIAWLEAFAAKPRGD